MPCIVKLRGAVAALCVALALLMASAAPGLAVERIQSFNATIEIAGDGTLTVTETIRVRAEGNQIRRGIYRDIPLAIDTPNGRILAGFELLSVTRDGEPDGYRVNRGGGGGRGGAKFPARRSPQLRRRDSATEHAARRLQRDVHTQGNPNPNH